EVHRAVGIDRDHHAATVLGTRGKHLGERGEHRVVELDDVEREAVLELIQASRLETGQLIVPEGAGEHVGIDLARHADDPVVAGAAFEYVASADCVDDIVPAATMDFIVEIGAEDEVIVLRALFADDLLAQLGPGPYGAIGEMNFLNRALWTEQLIAEEHRIFAVTDREQHVVCALT